MPSFVCPVCDTRVSVADRREAVYLPFCSRRCKLVDLGRWLDGSYAVPGPPIEKDRKFPGLSGEDVIEGDDG